jgi:hypothetical protein
VNGDGVAIVLTKLNAALTTIEVGASRRLSAAWAAVTFPEDGNSEAELVNTLFRRLDAARRPSRSSTSQQAASAE